MLHSVIMAGGSGTRFWPASRSTYPKQLLPIGTPRPLVEETVDRISELVPPERVLIVTNAAYAGMTRELLSEVPPENVIGEPAGRDTSACIGLAALILHAGDPDALMAVMPSDHIISPPRVFCATLEAAAGLLEKRKEALVTFGIQPTFPSTGYGYIKQGLERDRVGGIAFCEVESFREKPNMETAISFLQEGGYYWNSGIFMWRADTILDMIARFLPELHKGLMRLKPALGTADFQEALEQVYPSLQKISIDFGVMEKAEERIVAAVDFGWDDVGSWRVLERLLEADSSGNFVQGDFQAIEAKNNIVSARGGMVGLIGVEGLIVVHTPDATLVCKKENAEAVKKLVETLKKEYR